MKKCLAVVFVTLFILIAANVLAYRYSVTKVRSFDVTEYGEYIYGHYLWQYLDEPLESVPDSLGPIPDSETLRTVAHDLWTEIYGETMKDEKPYLVYYDAANEVWHIEGSRPFSISSDIFGVSHFGGVAHLIVQETDGRILALWHDK